MEKKFNLEERLIDFAAIMIDISEALPPHWLVITSVVSFSVAAPPLLCTTAKHRPQKALLISFTK